MVRNQVLALGRRQRDPSTADARQRRSIANPESRASSPKDWYSYQMLDETSDGKKFFLVRYTANSPVIHEIGRLREVAFRAVDEGTGGERDLDRYDVYYDHIVLWNDYELEIVGAYRLGNSASILKAAGWAACTPTVPFRAVNV